MMYSTLILWNWLIIAKGIVHLIVFRLCITFLYFIITYAMCVCVCSGSMRIQMVSKDSIASHCEMDIDVTKNIVGLLLQVIRAHTWEKLLMHMRLFSLALH